MSPSSQAKEEPKTTKTLSLEYRIKKLDEKSKSEENSKSDVNFFDITPTDLIHSEEALSSLYSFVLKQKSIGRGNASMCRKWLGKRVELTIGIKTTDEEAETAEVQNMRTIYGIVTSVVSGPIEDYESRIQGWYTLTIEPEFSAACYSRNRAVYLSDAAPSMTEDAEEPEVSSKKDKDDMRCQVLLDIADRWNTVCVVSPNAKKRIPDYLQLVQNDESDYNFFCRLLSTWGLGYCWKMDESEDVKKEYIYVYDVLGGENPNQEEEDAEKKKTGTPVPPLACMYSRGSDLPAWRLNRGYHSLDLNKIDVQNYLGAFSTGTADANRLLLSLHDETWDQLQSKATDEAAYGKWHFLNRHFNAGDVHGIYGYDYEVQHSDDAESAFEETLKLRMGAKVTWAAGVAAPFDPAEIDKSPYFMTKRVMSGSRSSINMEFSGRAPYEFVLQKPDPSIPGSKGVTQTIGGGILPRPLTPNADPDLDEDAPLLKEAAWESPKPRTFMAVVTSNVPHNYQGRNFCRVRELNGEEMWVEMGSPNADSNSGIFARPRKDNVLFCMDRGDLSIPIVLSAMFRGRSDVNNDTTNAAPAVKLKTMDRHTRTENGTIDENSALTLRSRTHEPQRSDTPSSTDKLLDVHDRDIKEEDLEFVQRPQSVEDLAEKPKPFSQIQMFSLDNGVRPIPQDDNIRNVYAVDPVIETVFGFTSESDLTAGYPICDAADAMQTANNIPISRPHLQGISMYSAGDMINQSADHQIMNAGGEIVLTAAQAITLRVGKSVIRISEYGIEMSSNAGNVYHAGAYPAYHKEDDAQDADCVTSKTIPLAGGSIMVNNAGVYSRGPYIANTAVNMFAANTVLGSAFTLSDFSGKLFAPSVKIIGGAALEKTTTSLYKDVIFGLGDIGKDAQPPAVYTGALVDGYKEEGYDWTTVASGCINEAFNAVGDVIGTVNTFKNAGNLFQPEGSMVKLEPEKMTLSSLAKFDYSSYSTTISSAASGFIATVENSSFLGGDVASKFSMCKTMYTWCSRLIEDIKNFRNIASSGGGGEDTYTPEDCDVKENPEPPKGKSSTESSLWFFGELIAGVVGVILALVNPAEVMAQILFGRRKDEVVGAANDVKLLTNEVQAETSHAIAAKETAYLNYAKASAQEDEAIAAAGKVAASANSSVADINAAMAVCNQAIQTKTSATQVLGDNTGVNTGNHACRTLNSTMEIKG